jgi:hypothetical protein
VRFCTGTDRTGELVIFLPPEVANTVSMPNQPGSIRRESRRRYPRRASTKSIKMASVQYK